METIDPIFNMHKIKFDTLDKWGLIDKTITRANVYINLDNVFKIIITPRINNFIQANASLEGYDNYMNLVSKTLVSNIINLGQHYRLWLAKQSIESRIILFWNFPVPEYFKNKKYIPTYKADYVSKHTRSIDNSHIIEAMIQAEKFCKDCITYINEVYLINGGELEASLIPYILDKEVYSKDGVNTKNFIISNSMYDFNYVNYGFTILAPSIRRKTPYVVNKNNVIDVIKNKFKSSSVLSVDSNFVEFIVSLLGDIEKNIPSITGVGIVTILRFICSAINEGSITPETRDIDMLLNILRDDYREIFNRNYHCVNLEYQYNDIELIDVHKLTSQLVDNFDETTLNEMNEKYFKLCPIDIIRPKSEQILYDRNPYTSIYDR